MTVYSKTPEHRRLSDELSDRLHLGSPYGPLEGLRVCVC